MEAQLQPISPEDRKSLTQFVRDLQGLLAELTEPTRVPIVPRWALRLLQSAWAEIQREERFESLILAVEGGEFDDQLANHGLRGDQLALKLGIFDRRAASVAASEQKLVRGYKRHKGLVGLALSAANVALTSLASVIPGGGIIEEFKSAAEAALKERITIRERVSNSRERFARWRQERREKRKRQLPTA